MTLKLEVGQNDVKAERADLQSCIWLHILDLDVLDSAVTMGKLLNFPQPQFCCHQTGDKRGTYLSRLL